MKYLVNLCILTLLISFSCQTKKQQRKTQKQEIVENSLADLDLNKIQERGKIIAVTEYNSTGYFIYKGQPMGYQYDLLKRLAKHLKVKLEIKVTSDIDKGIEMLDKGDCDILAFHLPVSRQGQSKIAYTEHHNISKQVLVQRKPKGWRKMNPSVMEKQLIRSPFGLIEKEIFVRKGAVFSIRLHNLSNEIGDEINIKEGEKEENTEDLVKKVSSGEIDYAIADEHVARVLSKYYENLDIATPISFSQKVSWAVRKNADSLLSETNHWMKSIKKTNEYYAIYDKYFKSSKTYRKRISSPYYSLNNRLSPYDNLLKKHAERIGWDWRLLASLVYQESKFDAEAQSYAGAVGLMQLMPGTAKRFGAKDFMLASESRRAGATYLQYLDRFWRKKIPNREERIKFILASYNVGQGHVLDAYKLTAKYDGNKKLWEQNVAYFLLQKSSPKYYQDPIVKSGYCRGREPVKYVNEVLQRYQHYKNLIK